VTAWPGEAAFIVGIVTMMAIRAPHGRRSAKINVVHSRKDGLEIVLLALMWITMLALPLVSIVTPFLSFADYALHPSAFVLGLVFLATALWLFYRSHADLGANWSISLELRETHALVTQGVYRRIRHPMYAAIFGQAIAQILLLPNWLAGPSCLVALLLMLPVRISREERMMLDKFGDDYASYRGRTKRLIPNFW
jgi:protein-S-isoprenylcysteine O-methyltransferase Ste14